MHSHRATVSLLLALSICACTRPPTCEAVADHVLELAKQNSSSVSVVDRASMIKNCQAESPGNAKMRECLMAATSLEDAKGCELKAALGK